jgi:hypothetical protein
MSIALISESPFREGIVFSLNVKEIPLCP